VEFKLEVLNEKCLEHNLLAEPIEFFPLGQVLDGDFSLNVVSVIVDPGGLARDAKCSTPALGECVADDVMDWPVLGNEAVAAEGDLDVGHETARLVEPEDGDVEFDGPCGCGRERGGGRRGRFGGRLGECQG
jgi:hypothetical protein